MNTKFMLIACAGNPNSLGNVCWAINKYLQDQGQIDTLLVLSSEAVTGEEVRELHNVVAKAAPSIKEPRIRDVSENPQMKISELMNSALQEMGGQNIVIDLTTGRKPMSSILYAASCFAQLDHIYYTEVSRIESKIPNLWDVNDSEYLVTHIKAVDPSASELASYGLFDVYYAGKEIDNIQNRISKLKSSEMAVMLTEVTGLVRSAYTDYLSPKSRFRESGIALGLARESIQDAILVSIKKHTGVEFSGIKEFENWPLPGKPGDKMPTKIPSHYLLSTYNRSIRLMRNILAHEPTSKPDKEQIRIALSTMIVIIQVILESENV